MKIVKSTVRSILRGLARLIGRHPIKVVALFALCTLWGIFLTFTRLGVVNDTNALIRQDSKVLRYFLDYLKEFETKDPMLVVIKSDDFYQNRDAVEALAQKFSARKEEILGLYYKNDLSKLKPHMLLYEDTANLKGIVEQIKSQKELLASAPEGVNINSLLDEGIRQFQLVEKAKGKRGTLDDLGMFADRMIKQLEILEQDLNPDRNTQETQNDGWESGSKELEWQVELNTYLAFDNGKMLLIQIIPGNPKENSFSPYEDLIANLRKDIKEVREQYPNVQIGLTGEPVLLDDELKQSTRDMIVASIVAFILISLLFFWAYREFVRPGLALLSLVCGLFWSLGFTVIAVGHFNIISQAFVLMLLGLGIDFGIQILGRYEEERATGLNVVEALENALQFTGLAVLTSGGITAIAFFTMCFNDFVGLAELGIIAGMGMVFCMIANLVLLPALLVLRDGKKDRDILPKHHEAQVAFGKELDRKLYSKPWTVLCVATVLTLFALFGAKKVRFDHNLLNMQNQKFEAVRLVKEMLSSSANSFLFGVIIADDLDDAKAKTKKLEALPTVREVVSPSRILPEGQKEKLKILKQLRKELDGLKFHPDVSRKINVERARVGLKELLDSSLEGLKEAKKFQQVKDPRVKQAMGIFDRLIPALDGSLKSLGKLNQEEAAKRLNHFQEKLFKHMGEDFEFLKGFDMETGVMLTDLPAEALAHYISPRGKVLLEVHPKGNVWEREDNEAFVKDLRSVSERATGTPVQNYVYIEILKESYIKAAWWALLAIMIVVGIYFRNPVRLLLTLLPLCLGVLWTLGCMGWLGVRFNPANIIMLPLVIGIGVAYGVYVIDRYREEERVRIFGTSTGKAILLSALTTIFGFGAMMLGNHKGLVSLGFVMVLGIGMCFVTSLIVLPQFLTLADRWKDDRKRPRD